ncbi:MAG: acetylglutamate kinase [Methanoregulaceae archaeon]|nr:acetylglutamate kinase [Methanoregulaceae archaeon]
MMGHAAISALRHAVPYLRLFRDSTFVVKVGGEALVRPGGADALLEQIGVLHSLGVRIVLVHGGGVQADVLAEKLGVEFEKIEGRRRTSPEMVDAMVLALNGEARAALLSAARKLGIPAVGISGMDAGFIDAHRRGPTPLASGGSVDLGEVGDIDDVDPALLGDLLDWGYLPIVSPLAGDAEGKWLNTNADTVAAEIAVSLGAAKAIFMTGAPGVLADVEDHHSLISELTLDEMDAMITDGAIQGGMLPKASAIARCLRGGVSRVHVVSHSLPDALLTEVFTNEGSGTLIKLEADED